jgi:hypothetical protein
MSSPALGSSVQPPHPDTLPLAANHPDVGRIAAPHDPSLAALDGLARAAGPAGTH